MINHYKETLLAQSTAVRTLVLPEVEKIVNAAQPDLHSVKTFKTNIIEWLRPIINLTGFSVYPTNGITEGLNWWASKTTYNIHRDPADYQWVDIVNDRLQPPSTYQSIPSSIDGNFKNIINAHEVALDLAYIGSTPVQKIEINDSVKHVFFSLSKPFGIRNIRTGWYFSKTPDKKLESLIYNAKYYNYFAADVAEAVISNFDIDHVYKRISTKQRDVCTSLGLTPSDSVWLATTEHEDYKKFRRSGNIARISLSGVYDIC